MLASPAVTALARRTGRPAMAVAAMVSLVGAGGLALAGTGPTASFVAGSVLGVAAVTAAIPLVTTTYERNFAAGERGRRVGRGMAVRVAVSALAGWLMGEHLTERPGSWWHVPLAGAAALGAVAWCQVRTPSEPLAQVEGRRSSALPHVHLLAEDRRLRLTLVAWMFMGFGNLMLLPLRVEYLARPGYGIAADPATITTLTVTVPSVVRLACMPLFGTLFDRMSFFSARIVVNLLFALYVAAFFSGTSMPGLVAGAVALGVASAGGDLMWSLWVTKFAPPERVADYMGLHTFSTGLRAVSAPLLAFAVVERFALTTVAWVAAAMMAVSSLVLLPEARLERRGRPTAGQASGRARR
jgi:hypothetical protein